MNKTTCSLLALLAIVCGSTTSDAQTYTLTDLGASTYAYGINDSGVVVGHFMSSGVGYACYWINGNRATIPMPSGGYTSHRAISINENDYIVGTAAGPTPPTRYGDDAFTYHIGDTESQLCPATWDTLPIGPTFGYGINNENYVSGWSAGAQRVFFYLIGETDANVVHSPSQSQIQTWIAFVNGGDPRTCDQGNHINDDLYITARASITPPGPGAGVFASQAPGNMSYTAVTDPSWPQLTGTAINNLEHFVAQNDVSGVSVPYFYNGNYTMISTSGSVHGINDFDFAVGATGGYAYIWSPGSGLVNLNSVTSNLPAGWTLIVARDVNNNGQIVGWAYDVFASRGNQIKAFLLTPN